MASLRQILLGTPGVALVSGLIIGAGAVGGSVIAGGRIAPLTAAPTLYDESKVVGLYQSANPATVEINTSTRSAPGSRFTQSGLGSGFVVDQDGNILTNNHVVQGATSVSVRFSDQTTATAQVIATNPAEDLALIRVSADKVKSITPLALGDSSLVQPGQMAIALGSPYGYQNSITVGVISGTNRVMQSETGGTIAGTLQTDASINPGNSGGPLMNSSGQVIGINTAIQTGGNGSAGVGFAVPINMAKDFLAQAKSGATITSTRPYLGITGAALNADVAQSIGTSVSQGVYLVAVVPGSPAESAGLQGSTDATDPGDVITAINGTNVSSVEDLIAQMAKYHPGDKVTLQVVHNGKSSQVSVTLGSWPGN